jgi:hypothetical protein
MDKQFRYMPALEMKIMAESDVYKLRRKTILW